MTKTHLLQEIRRMRFTELYGRWRSGRLSDTEAAYSPAARGRSERMFKTLQDRLVKELALVGITSGFKSAHMNTRTDHWLFFMVRAV